MPSAAMLRNVSIPCEFPRNGLCYLRLPVERDFSSFHWKTLQHEGAHAFLRNLVARNEVPP